MRTEIDHAGYPRRLKRKSLSELQYILRDAKAAIKAMPDGHKAGYYADEINYVCMEINRRRKLACQKGDR